MIGRTCRVTSPVQSGAILTGLKICIVGLSFVELKMDKTVDLKLLCRSLYGNGP